MRIVCAVALTAIADALGVVSLGRRRVMAIAIGNKRTQSW
jgi:hypothetical protein